MNKKVLVVDDDRGILDAVSLILEDSGYIVETLSNGEETFKKIFSFGPHVILLDILMSGTDGRDICKQLKADQKTHHIPVIMVAAHRYVGQEAKAAGADDFLPKPFDIADLLGKVEKHLQN
jgi:DNA-binding response OmpR family regulator